MTLPLLPILLLPQPLLPLRRRPIRGGWGGSRPTLPIGLYIPLRGGYLLRPLRALEEVPPPLLLYAWIPMARNPPPTIEDWLLYYRRVSMPEGSPPSPSNVAVGLSIVRDLVRIVVDVVVSGCSMLLYLLFYCTLLSIFLLWCSFYYMLCFC